jgi:predicted RNA-binding protein (virulence factor B family)
MEVKEVNPLGVFLEWGLAKDLLVPFGQQWQKMSVGRSYLVYVYIDAQTDRIVASAKIEKFLIDESELDPALFTIGNKITVTPYEHTNLGIKCLAYNCKIGILFKNKVFTNVILGEPIEVYIDNIREDGKLDLRSEEIGLVRIDKQRDALLSALNKQNGILYLHDKSPAEEIYQHLGMSKKDFKKAVGALYKSKLIALYPDCISLL